MAQAYITHRSSERVQNIAVPVPRVLWHGLYRTHRSSGYGCKSFTELPEVPGTGMKVVQNFQTFRVLWHGRTEITEVPGRCENAVPVPRVFVARGGTELTNAPGTGKNPVKYTGSGEEFDLKWRISWSLHGMVSLWVNVPEAIRRIYI